MTSLFVLVSLACGKNISGTLNHRLVCHFFVLATHVICDQLLNKTTATWNLFVKYTYNSQACQFLLSEGDGVCSLEAEQNKWN